MNFDELRNFETFIFDCDGVLWNLNKVVDGATDVINTMKSKGKRVIFLSNNSSKSREEYVQKFRKMGFHANEEEVVSSGFAAAQYLQQTSFSGKLFVIGSPGLGRELSNAHIRHVGIGPDLEKREEFVARGVDPEVTGVIVGYDEHFNYTKVCKAATYIHRGCTFYATNDDASMPSDRPGYIVAGTGSIVKSVEVASGCKPIIMGKPHPPIFKTLSSIHHIDPKKTVMIGDRIDTDIFFGKNNSLISVLVLTGVTTRSNLDTVLNDTDPHFHPDFIIDSVKDFLSILNS